jgi:hypothetical protein
MREAQADTPTEVTQPHTSTISSHLAAAGHLMRTTADPAAIADAIDAVAADDWSDDTLNSLRSIALDLGSALRAVAAANPKRDD